MQKEYYLAIKRMEFYDLPQQMIGMGDCCANWINSDTEKQATVDSYHRKIWKSTES